MKTIPLPATILAGLLSVGVAQSQTRVSVPPPPPDVLFEVSAGMEADPIPMPPEIAFVGEVQMALDMPLSGTVLLAQAGTPGGGSFAEQMERAQLETAMEEVGRAQEEAKRVRSDMEQIKAKIVTDKMVTFKGSDRDRSLYVPAGPVDGKVQDEIEEDLNIMGRLIQNAIADVVEDGNDRRAMGIKIRSLSIGPGPRNLQIDGYGALFEASVPFPLVPPAGETRADKPKENTNSAWEEARRQVSRGQEGLVSAGTVTHRVEPVEYDGAKVEALKTALIDALGNASHMRHLQSKDFATVVVRSDGMQMFSYHPRGEPGGPTTLYSQRTEKGPEGPARATPKPPRPAGGGGIVTRAGRSSEGSTMTIRVKKSDVDALGKGDLKPEDFRKRALVVVN